jgi:hypothetical protein
VLYAPGAPHLLLLHLLLMLLLMLLWLCSASGAAHDTALPNIKLIGSRADQGDDYWVANPSYWPGLRCYHS